MGIESIVTREREENYFLGDYKGYSIEIDRDSDDDNWYIEVSAPSGTHDYDGYWRDSCANSLDEAICEAFVGAMLSEVGNEEDGGGNE